MKGCRWIAPLLVAMSVTVAAGLVEAQVKPGAQVEVERFGNWMPGTVTRMTGTGWPYVKFRDPRSGREVEQLFPSRRVRLAKPKNLDRIRKPRKWTTADGTFSVEASLMQVLSDESVRLKRTDTGALITVPLNKLSDSDRSFVSLAQKSLGTSDSPMEDNASTTAESGEQPNDPLGSLPVGPTDAATMISVDQPGGTFVADPASSAVEVPTLSIQRPLPKDKSDFHDDVKVALSQSYRTAAVTVFNTFVDRESTSLMLYHLPTARKVAEGKLPKDTRVLAVSDRGDQIFTTTGWPSAKIDAIQIWTAQNGQITATGGWRSGGTRALGIRDAQCVPGNRLLMTAGEFSVLWDVDSATATHAFPIQRQSKPAPSANRRNVAFVGKDGKAHVIDLSVLKTVRSLELPQNMRPYGLAFDGSGQRLAIADSQRVLIWDLAANSLQAEHTLIRHIHGEMLHWCDADHLLLAGGTLLHVPTGATVWTYDLPKWAGLLKDGRQWALQWSQQGGSLRPISAPHQEVLAKTATLAKDQLIQVEPTTATITLGQLFVDANQVRQALQKRLTDKGFQLAGAGDLQIEVSSERGKTQTEGVKDFFSGPFAPATGSITFTPTIIKQKVTYKGHVLYDGKRTLTCPNPIRLEKGETAQGAATRYCTPKLTNYTSVFIPGAGPLLPNGKESYGRSRLIDAQ